ncbi:histidine kinase [[Flexibacter] sp. ATCC 35208]|uniref:histidine kinase n=1 Tax=[Flexibacter] sp. ATCC 35208 TaxID=1936242 RepID=UPI0009D3BE18|nr:histidine kinase [[Flexibacter] sp. ATCC 35208]OMP80103.1 hypothetical protein BW716_06315 [[Flexibacter] sp. ATCC 35208]
MDKRDFKTLKTALDSVSPHIYALRNDTVLFMLLDFRIIQLELAGDYKSAKDSIMRALEFGYRKDTTGKFYISAETHLGEWYMRVDSLAAAIPYLEEAYYLSRKNDTTQAIEICYSLATIFGKLKDYPGLKKYLDAGWQLIPGLKYERESYTAQFACNYVGYYSDMHNPDSAYYYYDLVKRDTTFVAPYLRAGLEWNITPVLIDQKQYEKAVRNQIYALAIVNQYAPLNPVLYNSVGKNLLLAGKNELAIKYADSALSINTNDKRWDIEAEAWRIKGEGLSNLGLYSLAYRAMDSAVVKWQIQTDSSLLKHIHELETQYQVKEKDDKIKSLAQLNAANEKINHLKNVIISALIGASILIGIIIFMWFRRRQTRNLLRETLLRQQLLRTQIEPHFIINTLSVLQAYILDIQTDKAVRYLRELSKLLHFSFQNARHPFISLDDEMAALQSYLELQVMQGEYNITYKFDIDSQLNDLEVFIPPMILQPFVENTLFHGFKGKSDRGIIDIVISKRGAVLHCLISDNGSGYSHHALSEGLITKSHATTIIADRLRILAKQTGQPAGVNIVSNDQTTGGSGTTVELIIPYRLTP